MPTIPLRLRRLVLERAQGRCEYCGLAQAGQSATFHIDHVQPVAGGGETVLENLALACVACSLHKAARSTAVDPETGTLAQLFNPRSDEWRTHFDWDDVTVVGLTPTGRATCALLRFNRPIIMEIRQEEKLRGRHPPKPDE